MLSGERLTTITLMLMFDEGDILFFDPFIFEDGTSKPKFFVVLKNDNGLSLLASLPTSKDHIVIEELLIRSPKFFVFVKAIDYYSGSVLTYTILHEVIYAFNYK